MAEQNCIAPKPPATPFDFRLCLKLLDGSRKISSRLSGDEQYIDRLVRECLHDDTVLEVDVLQGDALARVEEAVFADSAA